MSKSFCFDPGLPSAVPSLSMNPSTSPSKLPSSAPSISLSPTIVGFKVVVEIQTDIWGSDTSWEITQSGNVVTSGDGYGNDQLYVIQERLPYGCYEFVIKDSFGDGLCCDFIDGYFKLFVEDELEFEGGSGEWELLSKSFCFDH